MAASESRALLGWPRQSSVCSRSVRLAGHGGPSESSLVEASSVLLSAFG